MNKIRVNLGERSYSVLVGRGLLKELGARIAACWKERKACAVVTDSTVGPIYAETVCQALRGVGCSPSLITVPAGEASKSMPRVEEVCGQMIRAGLDRSSLVVALGGGVIGDLAGFCAGILYRGIAYVQVPTTVVAQVDSSIGGKTGVNTPEGKNLLGTFHQPRLVLADVDTLETLPGRELNEGFAEIIKHSAIRDAGMLPLIKRAARDRTVWPEIIARNVAIKAHIVEADEREAGGARALLNFGHTIGHAIEASAGYGVMLHGEAIALGMIAALRLSQETGNLQPQDSARIEALLRLFQLPQRLPASVSTPDIMTKLSRDKKFAAGRVRFVLLRRLGDAFVSDDVTLPQIESAVEALR
ncbi:MAG: 3-dehydroquinate synthase [Verrucomicrobiales bacterium]